MTKKEWARIILIALLDWALIVALLFLFFMAALSVYEYSNPQYPSAILYTIEAIILLVIYGVLMYFILKGYNRMQKLKIWFYGLLACIAMVSLFSYTICGL